MPWLKRNCKYCKREFNFYFDKSRIDRGIYCSRSCSAKFRKPRYIDGRTKNTKCIICYKKIYFGHIYCKTHAHAKDRNWKWRGGVTSQNQLERVKFVETIRIIVFERDDYTCQLCGKRGGSLTVDHIQSWAEYVELRFNIDNCRTLCAPCHYEITFGKPMPKNSKWGNVHAKEIRNG